MSFLFGNIYVAFLIALSILTLAIYDLLPVGINDTNGSKGNDGETGHRGETGQEGEYGADAPSDTFITQI